MIAQPLQHYFWFGTCVRYLQDIPENTLVADDAESGYVRENLRAFFRYVESLGLRVVARLRDTQRLAELLAELEQAPAGTQLSSAQALRIRSAMLGLRDTLEAELEGVSAYTVTPKRYDTSLLLHNIPALFSPGIFERLPPIARYDLEEAGRCLAFERPTAAAFHILRATEAVLRLFYATLVRRGRTASMWGPMVTHLRARRTGSAHLALLDNLDNIRRSYRNPTQHPEAIYTVDETQDLLGVCTDVLNRMGRVIPAAV